MKFIKRVFKRLFLTTQYLLFNKRFIYLYNGRPRFFYGTNSYRQFNHAHLYLSNRKRHFEYLISSFTIDKIESGIDIIDVGGNLGWWSIGLCKYFTENKWKEPSILSIEPVPYNYYRLSRNIKHISNSQVINCAISNSEKSIRLGIPDDSNDTGLYTALSPNFSSVEVPAVKLDDLFHEENTILKGCDLLKIDVEGFEYSVLLSSFDLIKKYKPIIYFEFIDGNSTHKYENFIEFLSNLGYRDFTPNDNLSRKKFDAIWVCE